MDFEQLIGKTRETLEKINATSHIERLSDATELVRRAEEQQMEDLRAKDEMIKDYQLQLDTLKDEYKVTNESIARIKADAARKNREASDLQESTATQRKEHDAMQSEMQAMKNELATLKGINTQSATDPVTLKLNVYRGLGIRKVQGTNEALLTSNDKKNVNKVCLEDYSDYFRAKYVWDYVSTV